ncbi:hypothetical protein LCGC14_3104810, partial [marine sediment metagenome]
GLWSADLAGQRFAPAVQTKAGDGQCVEDEGEQLNGGRRQSVGP